MNKRILLAAPRSFCAGVARLRRAPVEETMFPPRAPFFFTRRLGARAEENERGNLTVSPKAPSLARASVVCQ